MSDFVTWTAWAWAAGAVGLLAAGFIYGYVKKQPSGSDLMVDIKLATNSGD